MRRSMGAGDVALFTVSAVLTVDSLATLAALGPQVLFWWPVLALAFFLPYGWIVAELGCTFPEQGGIYAWVKDAFGEEWGARMTWCYWVNVAVWVPALCILCTGVLGELAGAELSLTVQVAAGIALCWLAVGVNLVALDTGKWVPNAGAVVKALLIAVIVFGAIRRGLSEGSATSFGGSALLPEWGESLRYLPTLIIGMLGLELASASSEEMKNPRRDVPRAIFASGIAIIVCYALATGAILVAVPAAEIDLVAGLLDTLRSVLGEEAAGRAATVALGTALSFAIFSSGVTWALGSNRAAAEAAKDGELPRLFALEGRSGTPRGAALALGISCTAILLIYGALARSDEDLFWTLFAFSSVIFLVPYAALAVAFPVLRVKYPDVERPFRVPGGQVFARGLAVLYGAGVTFALVLFCWVPGDGVQWPILAGSLSLLAVGEALVRTERHGRRA